MSKLYFKTGVMGSGKTLDLARVKYNYEEKGMKVLLYKPRTDTRDGVDDCFIGSRALGYKIPARWISDKMAEDIEKVNPSIVIIDESQFLSKEQVDEIQKICYNYNIPIILYGLKTTFQGLLFEGTKRILEVCDKVEEFKCMCKCGNVAKQNARMLNGKITKDGEVVAIGGNELYTGVCNKCFYIGGKNNNE
ncbi:thymidine kinase [Clostridium sp.]|uniref:thymidine kinase n=1 Tax=Clostridium sp. TaxID=1506 RepID=UPI002FCA8BC7